MASRARNVRRRSSSGAYSRLSSSANGSATLYREGFHCQARSSVSHQRSLEEIVLEHRPVGADGRAQRSGIDTAQRREPALDLLERRRA